MIKGKVIVTRNPEITAYEIAVANGFVGTEADWLASIGKTYKVYTALLTQTGTNAPVATVLENTLGGALVWSYVSTGVYKGTLAGAFPENKTNIQSLLHNTIIVGNYLDVYIIYESGLIRANNNECILSTATSPGGIKGNDVLTGTFIEIRVYP